MMPFSIDPISFYIVIAAVSMLPFVAMIVTSYAKIVIVLTLLRNALGVQQVPPSMVLNGAAMILSCYIMAPVFMQASDRIKLTEPVPNASTAQQIGKVMTAAAAPIKLFLDKHAAEREKTFFLRSATAIWPPERAQQLQKDDLLVLAPAFLLTELAEAFRIGFLLYVVFTVVDLVIANVLLSMGLSQVTPTNVAIPFKLLLFVALDGWSTLAHGLVLTYR